MNWMKSVASLVFFEPFITAIIWLPETWPAPNSILRLRLLALLAAATRPFQAKVMTTSPLRMFWIDSSPLFHHLM